MEWDIIFVLIMIGLMMVGLILEIARPDLIVFGVLVIFFITDIISAEQMASGFSNQGMLTVAMLFIVAGAVEKSGLVDQVIARVLRNHKTPQKSLFKFLLPVMGFSGFLNNTPIVMTLTPVIRKWCAEHNISPSKFLIPLSYAAILGGTLTLIGTSTNLLVSGLMQERGMEGFSLFEFTIVSLPAAILGLIYIVIFGYKILPNYKGLTKTVEENSQEYLSEAIIESSFPFINKTVKQAGLRKLKGLYLIEIIRDEERISPVKNTTRIQSGDHLIFTGLINSIAELQNKKGIKLKTDTDVTLDTLKNGNKKLVEVVVSHQSSLLHQKIQYTNFRAKYDAGVIAVHRNNQRIKSKIGDIELQPGDTLLLITGTDFKQRATQSNDFYIVTPLDNNHPLLTDNKKGWFAVSILIIMILLVAFNVMSMFKAMSIAVLLYLVFRIISPEEAKGNVQFSVLLLIASAFGISKALFETETDDWLAEKIIMIAEPLGTIGILFLLYLLTAIFTELITNNAAAVLMFPIAMSVANNLNIDQTGTIGFAILITIGASASFLSPIGYQTNLLVYGPGGYKYTDFMKVGAPLSLIVMCTTVSMVYFFWL